MRSIPSVSNANGTPALARTAAVLDQLLPLGLAVGQDPQWFGRARLGRPFLILILARNLGLDREIEPEHDRHFTGFEPVDDLVGLFTADDDRSGAELLGEVERPVDLVARVGLPPDVELLGPRGLKGFEGRINRRVRRPRGPGKKCRAVRACSLSSIACRKWAIEPISTRG